jgi:hypothetical protein
LELEGKPPPEREGIWEMEKGVATRITFRTLENRTKQCKLCGRKFESKTIQAIRDHITQYHILQVQKLILTTSTGKILIDINELIKPTDKYGSKPDFLRLKKVTVIEPEKNRQSKDAQLTVEGDTPTSSEQEENDNIIEPSSSPLQTASQTSIAEKPPLDQSLPTNTNNTAEIQ